MKVGRTHYETLGVSPSASPETIREAYRDLARRFHPDRQTGSAAGADHMPAVNEAYRVLSDPARRAVYDASLRPSSERVVTDAPAGATSRLHDHDDDYAVRLRESRRPVRVPWRTLVVCTVAAVIGVVVLAQFGNRSDGPIVDGIMRIGDCAEVLPDGRAAEVACQPGGTGDLVVMALIPFEARCDFGQLQHQDRQGMGIVCLEPRP